MPSIVSPHETGPRARAVHLLNRIGFGPRPGDVDRVLQRGFDKTVEDQLYPADIEDAEVEERVSGLTDIRSTTADLLARYPQNMGSGRIIDELGTWRLTRAVVSERQLYEVLVDFWFNHFNVYAPEAFTRYSTPSYELDAIRPHALGSFRDLLGATARHPAMLYYLDNWLSTVARPQGGRVVGGLNENYGREVLELHTLGVDGGYTQEDVIQTARAFTGWTIDNIARSGRFVFNARNHEPGDKAVLAHRIPGGSVEEGEMVLDMLASHPSTARHVSWRLSQRFIADDPPASVVSRATATFQSTRGDIRRVVQSILTSPEFMSPEYFGAKAKTPFELVASTLRSVDASATNWGAATAAISQMGMPLYSMIPPTGYSNDGREWMNASSLLNRMNFAFDLASGALRGLTPRLDGLLEGVDRSSPTAVATRVAEQIFGYRLSQATFDAASRPPTAGVSVVSRVVSLMLAGPEFQGR